MSINVRAIRDRVGQNGVQKNLEVRPFIWQSGIMKC